MDTTAKRPWYRLHWGTVFTVFFVGIAWIGHAFPTTTGLAWPWSWPSEGYAVPIWRAEGWPLICIQKHGADRITETLSLVIDCGLIAVSLTCVAFVVEGLECGALRIRLSTILLIVAAFSVVFALMRWDEQLVNDPEWASVTDHHAMRAYTPLTYADWYIAAPILFALASLIYTVLRIALMATTESLAFLRRPAPTKVEADGSPPK